MASKAEAQPATSRAHRWPRRLVWIAAAAVLLPLSVEAYRVVVGSNFHTVLPGRIYRCAQPTAASLESAIADHGIRTIINLRGPGDVVDWYGDETRTAHKHNVSHEDINLSAGRLPSVTELRRLVLVLEQTEYPILLHCRRGSDRTGVAAAVALLLTTDLPWHVARRQLNWRFGHIAVGRTAQLDQFFDFYQDWLQSVGQSHSRDAFHHWAMAEYRPGKYLSEIALAEPAPAAVAPGDPIALRVRATNAGTEPWALRPQATAGVHLGCFIYDGQDRLLEVIKTGLRDGEVRPGEAAAFTLVVPALRQPGPYHLRIDMIDEQQCWFYQTGSQPLEMELVVRD